MIPRLKAGLKKTWLFISNSRQPEEQC